jgi:hypothetical protein
MSISFKQVRAIGGAVSTTTTLYTDEQGVMWFVPLGTGHRFEEIYNEWLAAGNTPESPAPQG